MDEKKKKLIDEMEKVYGELDPEHQKIIDGLAIAMYRETPAEKEVEGDPNTWWYVCPECHTAVDPGDRYCRECGQRLK